eukprot:CAMPEP_0184327690 /NCGR_PEP_ID=MMETSP1049-20130417/143205_1 /TAXON_ID=77928 /ORGANISM="Proteomonas sulcata, Strain CCMP704" /LENGTH=382 /DNA_ID=CAMNT_0026649957 /DNA_START=335 /DNA_END=1483 /DNA_ORIENTATION=+
MSDSQSEPESYHERSSGYGGEFSEGDLTSDSGGETPPGTSDPEVEGLDVGALYSEELRYLGQLDLEGQYHEGEGDLNLDSEDPDLDSDMESEPADDEAHLVQLMLGHMTMEESGMGGEEDAWNPDLARLVGETAGEAQPPPEEDDSADGDSDNFSESHLFADDADSDGPPLSSDAATDQEEGEWASIRHQGHWLEAHPQSDEWNPANPDDRPIRPAGERLLRAFDGHHPLFLDDDDDNEDTLGSRLAFEDALLSVDGMEDVTDPDSEFEENEGLNDVGAQEILRRAREDTDRPGMDAEELNRIPIYRYDGAEAKDCSICLMGMEEGQEATMLPCTHLFHYTCIMRWLARSRKCPFCRSEVTNPPPQDGSPTLVHDQDGNPVF